MLDQVLDAGQALAVGRKHQHQLVGHQHGADIADVGDAGARINQHVREAFGQDFGEHAHQARRTHVEPFPVKGVDAVRIVVVEPAGLE